VKRVYNRIFDFFEIHLPVFVLLLLVATVTVQVFSRYVLDRPLPKFFELSIYSFVWSIYLGAALAKRYDKHIRFDILYKKFSKNTRVVIDVFFDILTSVVFLFVLYPSIKYSIMNYSIKASSLRVPWTYLLVCFPLFTLLILIHNIQAVIRNIRLLMGHSVPEKEALPWL